MESEYNAGQGTRDILREAISQPTLEDGILVMELYRRYERCYGTCESIAACQAMEMPGDRPRPRIKVQQVYPRQQQQPPQNREPLNREQRRRQAHEQQQPPLGKKRPLPKSASRTESPEGSQPPSKARLAENPTAAEAKESNFKYSRESQRLATSFIHLRHFYFCSQFGDQQDLCEEPASRLHQRGVAWAILALWQHQRCAPGAQAVSGGVLSQGFQS